MLTEHLLCTRHCSRPFTRASLTLKTVRKLRAETLVPCLGSHSAYMASWSLAPELRLFLTLNGSPRASSNGWDDSLALGSDLKQLPASPGFLF